MSRFTSFGALPVVVGIALLFVPGTGLYGALLLALGLGMLTIRLGLLLKPTDGDRTYDKPTGDPRTGRRLAALTACVLLAESAPLP
jgi:hypothetical protein